MKDYEVRLLDADGNMSSAPWRMSGLCAAHAVENVLNEAIIDYDAEGTAEVILESGAILRFPFIKP